LSLWRDSLLHGFEKVGFTPQQFHLEVSRHGNVLANLLREEQKLSADDNCRAIGGIVDIKAKVGVALFDG